MVRVGGGWVALDEFLVKNDPCRGMLYRNYFILPFQNKFIEKKIYFKNKRIVTKKLKDAKEKRNEVNLINFANKNKNFNAK